MPLIEERRRRRLSEAIRATGDEDDRHALLPVIRGANARTASDLERVYEYAIRPTA
jgi:hypothetical protein